MSGPTNDGDDENGENDLSCGKIYEDFLLEELSEYE